MNEITNKMFQMIKHELLNTECNIDDISDETLIKLYKLSNFHNISHIVGNFLLEKNLVQNNEIKSKYFNKISIAVLMYEKFKVDIEEIKQIFDANNIKYILLKGIVIRKFYEKAWERNSCDLDILVDKKEIERAKEVLVKNGFNYTGQSTHDYAFETESGNNLELHFSLSDDFLDSKKNILKNVWEYATIKENSEYELSNEMFYFYIVSHIAKHFYCGGCGVRSILDIFILEKNLKINKQLFYQYLDSASLRLFYENIVKVAYFWLDDKKSDEFIEEVSNYILSGGIYGTRQNSVINHYNKKGNKLKYYLSRIFIPYKDLCPSYPIIKKCKILYPLFIVVRLSKVFRKDKRKNISAESSVLNNATIEEVNKRRELFSRLGLK